MPIYLQVKIKHIAYRNTFVAITYKLLQPIRNIFKLIVVLVLRIISKTMAVLCHMFFFQIV